MPDVVNDLDVDFSANPAAAEAYKNDQRNIRKVREATAKLKDKINIINPLREGQRLLVLDIDYSMLRFFSPPLIMCEYWKLVFSYRRYKAPNIWGLAPTRMCSTGSA